MRVTLRPKMMLGVLGPVAVVLALFAYVQYNVQRHVLLDVAARTATDLSNVIEGSLQHAMLTRNRAAIQTSIDDIATNPQVVNLFLLNPESEVRAGIPQELRGRQFSLGDDGCAECHVPGAPHEGEFSAVLTLPDAGRILRNCNPIENRDACQQCHDPRKPYNGVLITDLRLTEVERQASSSLQQALLLFGGALLLGAALLGVTMERSVIQPLSQLTQAIRDFDRGDLARRVQINISDEIGELARAFNQMAGGVGEKVQLEQRLRQHTLELERLYAALQEKEAMRAQLLRQAITAQEEERARLSRELHDEIGQTLTAVQLSLDRLSRTLPATDTDARERLDRTRTLTEQTLADLRRVIAALRPGVLDQLGLVPALGWVADHTLRPLGLQVSVETNELHGRLPGEIETILFRIAQEAMSNVARHSQANHLTIWLVQTDGQVTMSLRDDGVGFDPSSVATPGLDQSRGLGLAGMQERASLAGGQVVVESAPGQGTTVRVVVPMPAPTEEMKGRRDGEIDSPGDC